MEQGSQEADLEQQVLVASPSLANGLGFALFLQQATAGLSEMVVTLFFDQSAAPTFVEFLADA